MILRKIFFATSVFAIFLGQTAYPQQASDAAASDAPPDKPSLHAIVTGYLLGYYRVPNVQAQDFLSSCWEGAAGDDPWSNASPGVRDLKRKRDIPFTRDDETLTIGMGDNFGIDMDSRVYGEEGRLHPKQSKPGYVPAAFAPDGHERKPDDPWPPMTAPEQIGDNVGCFLSLAGYDVIVPGKLDFYFGPERLRRIAQRLASIPQPGASKKDGDKENENEDRRFHPVQTLAVNLIQRTSYWKEPPKIPDSEKKLGFIPGLPEGLQAVEVTDHSTVLPFLQSVTFRGPKEIDPAPYLCKGEAVDDLDEKLPCKPDGTDRVKIDALCGSKGMAACLEKEGKELRTYSLKGLEAEANYGLCTQAAGLDKPNCVRFTVARPYFLGPFSALCPDTSEKCRQWQKPYYYKHWKDGRQVVIFGVVDPDFPSLVGRDNLSWRNVDGRLETSVAVLDPVKSLQEAEQLFEQEQAGIDKSKLRRILLAQMSRAKAEELASHLDFDVVIAGAQDRGHATGSVELTYFPEPTADGSPGETFRTSVVVPERSLDPSRKLINPVREIAMRDYSKSAAGGARRKVTVTTNWDQIAREPITENPSVSLQKRLDQSAGKLLKMEKTPDNNLFITATLKIMREKTKADLAMMQKRDFYFGSQHTSEHMGENIAGVLWKGDVLQVITVTGDTLKKVLRESKQFDQADIQPTKGHDESNRGLLLYGVENTEDGNFLVDGQLVDKDRLYTVATTSHISAGDTGFPELNDPLLSNKFLPQSSQEEVSQAGYGGAEGGPAQGKQISELVCDEMRPQLEEDGSRQPGCITDEGNGLFASSDQQAPQVRTDLLTRMVAWSRISMDRPVLPKDKKQTGQQIAEDDVQNRPTWRLSLKELSWNFGAVRNNLSEVQRVTSLTGASDPAAYAAKGHSIDYATRAEWVRGTDSVDEFVRGQLLFKANSTGATKTVGPTSTVVASLPNVSHSKNEALLDTGFFWHGLGRNKFFPQQGIVFEPFHFDTDLFENSLPINAHFNSSGTLDRAAYTVPLERTRLFLGRVGYRFQNKNNSFEMGYEGGWEANALEKLIFQVGSQMSECDLKAQQTLSSCLAAQPITIQPRSIHQIRATRTRNGVYVNLDWTLPLISRMSFVALDQGEYFREDKLDNSSDTLYRNIASGTVRIAIWQNFSVAPGLERLDYENKLNHTHLRTWEPVLKLVYNFDQYSGGSWGKATRFRPAGK